MNNKKMYILVFFLLSSNLALAMESEDEKEISKSQENLDSMEKSEASKKFNRKEFVKFANEAPYFESIEDKYIKQGIRNLKETNPKEYKRLKTQLIGQINKENEEGEKNSNQYELLCTLLGLTNEVLQTKYAQESEKKSDLEAQKSELEKETEELKKRNRQKLYGLGIMFITALAGYISTTYLGTSCEQ